MCNLVTPWILLVAGARNSRGVQLANWVLQNGLQILSRQSDNQDTSESWTCESYFDEARVQLDYIIAIDAIGLYLSEYWKFANYVALLDDNRWVKRILHWNPGGGRPGRPFFQWQTPLQNFCRWHHLGNWIDTAGSTDLWFQYYTDFISFCQR